jgi:hypothetical protein
MTGVSEASGIDWDSKTMGQLLNKRKLATLLIREIEAHWQDHPNHHERLAELRQQRREINEAIWRKRYGEEGPPAQQIGMKPASVKGRALR